MLKLTPGLLLMLCMTLVLGVMLDVELTMVKHIAKITICYHHLQRLNQVRQILGPEVAARLVSTYVISRLDYCNSVLAGLPKASIMLLRVQNTTARLIKLLDLRDHVLLTICDLHWVPVKYQLTYKLCLMMHAANIHRCPGHIAELLIMTSSVISCSRLRSASSNCYEVPRTRLKFGDRAFSIAGPTAWHSLPKEITAIASTEQFKAQFKNYLCNLAYSNIYN